MMTEDKLKYLNSKLEVIKEITSKIISLKLDILFLNKTTESTTLTIRGKMKYYDYNKSHNGEFVDRDVTTLISKEAVVKIVEKKLYINQNLLKKYKLEFEKM